MQYSQPSENFRLSGIAGAGRQKLMLADAVANEYNVIHVHGNARPGRLTQRLECHLHTVEVTGSIPVSPILTLIRIKIYVTADVSIRRSRGWQELVCPGIAKIE